MKLKKKNEIRKNNLAGKLDPREFREFTKGLPGPKKLKRPNLAVSCFKNHFISGKKFQKWQPCFLVFRRWEGTITTKCSTPN